MQPGDILQRYRKHNYKAADFFVVLGRQRGRPHNIKLLGFFKDGTPSSVYAIFEDRVREMYRVVGHADFVFDINRQIKLITEPKDE